MSGLKSSFKDKVRNIKSDFNQLLNTKQSNGIEKHEKYDNEHLIMS